MYDIQRSIDMKQNENRKIIIDGNAVYELDNDCILKKRLENKKEIDKYVNIKKEKDLK